MKGIHLGLLFILCVQHVRDRASGGSYRHWAWSSGEENCVWPASMCRIWERPFDSACGVQERRGVSGQLASAAFREALLTV